MFILDTDVLSNLRKEKKSPLVQAWIFGTAATDLATTVITIAEIQCGIERQMPSDATYAAGTQRWLDELLAIGGMHVIPLGAPAALLLAKMHETAGASPPGCPGHRQLAAKPIGQFVQSGLSDCYIEVAMDDASVEIQVCLTPPSERDVRLVLQLAPVLKALKIELI